MRSKSPMWGKLLSYECGRRDSNSYGIQGPVRVTKDLFPAASKAAVYADFTTPAAFKRKKKPGTRPGRFQFKPLSARARVLSCEMQDRALAQVVSQPD